MTKLFCALFIHTVCTFYAHFYLHPPFHLRTFVLEEWANHSLLHKLMKQIIPVNNGSVTTAQKSQSRHIIPSLQPRVEWINNDSPLNDSAPKFIAYTFIFKEKSNSVTNVSNPFSSGLLPTLCDNSPPS